MGGQGAVDMSKIIRTTILVIGLVLMFVVEDGVLWLAPMLSGSARQASRRRAFEAQCRKISVGMTMSDAVETMSRGTTVPYQVYRPKIGQPEVPTLVFWQNEAPGTDGNCIVTLDRSAQSVTQVHFAWVPLLRNLDGIIEFDH